MVDFAQFKRETLRYLRKNWEYKIAIFVILYYVVSNIILETTHTFREIGLNNRLRVLPIEVIQYYDKSREIGDDGLNPEKFAYMQYATNYEYLNLAVMNFIVLKRSGTKVENFVILYDQQLHHADHDIWNRMFHLANRNGIHLKPVPLLTARFSDESSWSGSFTKFHIFNQLEFDRVVFFDSDSMLINIPREGDLNLETLHNAYGNLDELFKLPKEIRFALPQAYWLNNAVEGKEYHKFNKKLEIPNDKRYKLRLRKLVSDIIRLNDPSQEFELLPTLVYEHHKFDNFDDFFANHVMVFTPSKDIFNSLMKYLYNPWWWHIFSRSSLKQKKDYDMEIMNKYLNDQLRSHQDIKIGILPHRVYGVLTGEFKEEWHKRFVVEPQYLPFIQKKDKNDGWNAMEVFKQIRLIHFSDAPIPKPWEDQDNLHYYNSFKIACENDSKEEFEKTYPEWKPRLTSDCDSVDIWNWYREEFKILQKDFWILG
ncbi:alphaN-acetylglucosamine transferase [Scheffersomyces xylosifermentans]|uniref:alphaN-acetylglucosamine transferase n=1 Tax=Scheffersomyces xylosifermentans TaxID=1304137 RepID=UPI00315D18E7